MVKLKVRRGRTVAALAGGVGAVAAVVAVGQGAGPVQVRPVAAVVNPWWEKVNQIAFGGRYADGDAWRSYPKAAGKTSDDGIVFFRVFIPAQLAAGNLLYGDDRDFSADPAAPSRAVVAWNTATGDVGVLVSHSTRTPPSDKPYVPKSSSALSIAALPIAPGADWAHAFAARDQVRDDNRIGIDAASAKNGTLRARISLLNPLTNGSLNPAFGLGAWSVDQELTITRKGPGDYRLNLIGNGYPAVEVYYYPKSGTQPKVIAKRTVAPLFQGQPLDAGGGTAARDFDSWNVCSAKTPTVLECRNTAPYEHHADGGWVTWWPWAQPSEQQWQAPWDTDASATKAL